MTSTKSQVASVDLNSKKESCTHETLETNLPLTNDITSSREEVTYLRLKETNNRLTSNNRLICAHLSTNSVGNKFDSLADIIKDNLDILVILEAKRDLFFLKGDFQLYDYLQLHDSTSEPYRFDRNENAGGILLFMLKDIP